ncbi:MAG: GNAT family N-acetyltransferase [bacterium]|nr:GNAT family N-acetyltransferase [bacterium]
MDRRKNGSFGQLAVTDKKTGEFLGLGGIIFREEPEAFGEWEIAYSLLPEARGKGYATELARYFRDWAFANTRVESVVSFVHINNVASQKVTVKNGMHIDKELTFFEMPCRLNRVYKNA